MLATFLKLLQNGENLSPADIAARMGISQEMVLMMSEQLTRQGYLDQIDPCNSACSGCPESSGCGPGKVGRVWMVTEKGQKTV
jgi:hypothetical protein